MLLRVSVRGPLVGSSRRRGRLNSMAGGGGHKAGINSKGDKVAVGFETRPGRLLLIQKQSKVKDREGLTLKRQSV